MIVWADCNERLAIDNTDLMKKLKAIILRNELEDDHLPWIYACEKFKNRIDYFVVDLTKNNWLNDIQSQKNDILLAKPSGLTSSFKQLYDERIYILNKVLGYPIFPSAEEIFIYENKRYLSFWLEAQKIPHPSTDVFYDQKEIQEYLNNRCFPIVGKVNIGASGRGVRIIKTKKEALEYAKKSFSGKGAPNRSGPNMEKGKLLKRGFHYIFHPFDISKKLTIYHQIRSNTQKGFVIFQEYIQHDFEWRVVRIGDSFFAHKKLKINEKASGTLLKNYEKPPLNLLSYVKELTDRFGFRSQAVDLFEIAQGKYLVNEMQCIFGQSDPFQMMVDGTPGRYLFIEKKWKFEPGDFCGHQCFDLRMEYVINQLSNKEMVSGNFNPNSDNDLD